MKGRQSPWHPVLGVLVSVAVVGMAVAPVSGEESSPTATAIAPTTTTLRPPPPSVPLSPPTPAAASVSFVAPTLVGPGTGGAAEPPPVRPEPRPTPITTGPVTLQGRMSPKAPVTIPALFLAGDGEVEISGDVRLRVAGDGTLWVDKASSVSLDPATTGTKTSQDDGWNWDRFSGTARVEGSNLKLRAKGARIMVRGDGTGSATMGGGMGMFRLIQEGGRFVSGYWKVTPITERFSKAETEVRPETVRRGSTKAPYGLIPVVPPPAREYPRKLLPSETSGTVTAPAATPPATVAPTTGTK